MKYPVLSLLVLAGVVTAGCSDTKTEPSMPQAPAPNYSLAAHPARTSFTFDGTVVSATGETVSLNGGGSFAPALANNVIPTETSVHGLGLFRCVTNITAGQIAGCGAGEGTRWDAAQLLQSSGFKCGGVANEAGKTATTGNGVVVLLARFFRATDHDHPSFTGKIFVSDHDLAPDVPGNQNLWIQGFGCGTGSVRFGG